MDWRGQRLATCTCTGTKIIETIEKTFQMVWRCTDSRTEKVRKQAGIKQFADLGHRPDVILVLISCVNLLPALRN